EEALAQALESMAFRGVEFEPELVVQGAEVIPCGGVILATGHFRLNRLFLRWLFDRGRPGAAGMKPPRPVPYVWGTRVRLDAILADRQVLLRLRRRLAAGATVFIDLDGPEPSPGARLVETVVGPRYVSDAVPRFAERLGLPVVFCSTLVQA